MTGSGNACDPRCFSCIFQDTGAAGAHRVRQSCTGTVVINAMLPRRHSLKVLYKQHSSGAFRNLFIVMHLFVLVVSFPPRHFGARAHEQHPIWEGVKCASVASCGGVPTVGALGGTAGQLQGTTCQNKSVKFREWCSRDLNVGNMDLVVNFARQVPFMSSSPSGPDVRLRTSCLSCCALPSRCV